jgi:hypothetical protein
MAVAAVGAISNAGYQGLKRYQKRRTRPELTRGSRGFKRSKVE